MQEVTTQDQRWHISVQWSPFDQRFSLGITRWQYDDAAARWAVEEMVAVPVVHPSDLEGETLKLLDQVLGQVEAMTSHPVKGPFGL